MIASAAATPANVSGSVGVVWNRKLSMTRVDSIAAPMPMTVPIAIGHIESRSIVRTT